MGARESKSSDAPQQKISATQEILLLEAQRQEYTRKLQEEASEAASLKKLLKEVFITNKRLEKEIVDTKKLLKVTTVKRISREATNITSFSNQRSYQAKTDVSPQKKVPCPRRGCKLNIRLVDMDIHVKECPFKDHDCPVGAVFGKCEWQGQISELTRHFDAKHPNCFVPEVGSEFRLKYIHGNHRYVRLIGKDCFFVFHAKISETDNNMCMTVQLIGMKESAMKCEYRIHLNNKYDCRIKYNYSDNCCSISDNIENIFQKKDCAVLSMELAKSLIYNGALYMKIFIDYSPL